MDHDNRRQEYGALEQHESQESHIIAPAPAYELSIDGNGTAQQHDTADFLASLGAADALADALIRSLDGRRVIHAFTEYPHRIARGSHSVYRAHLEIQRAAGDNSDAAGFPRHILTARFQHIARLVGKMPLAQDSEFHGDGRGRHVVFTEEQTALDARLWQRSTEPTAPTRWDSAIPTKSTNIIPDFNPAR